MGMIGAGTLLKCLDDARVERVLAVVRKPTGVRHAKLEEALHHDFYDYSSLQGRWPGFDACLFCLGVTSVGMAEAPYRRITSDLTLAVARSMVAVNPGMVFCYVSGKSTDSTARGRVMWARVKGRTENAILGMGFKAAFMFRPAFIQPLKGVRSKAWYQPLITVLSPLFPLLQKIVPQYVTTTENVGRAMIQAAAIGYPKRVLESDDINRLAVA